MTLCITIQRRTDEVEPLKNCGILILQRPQCEVTDFDAAAVGGERG